MIINFITLTHARKKIFLKTFEKNLKLIQNNKDKLLKLSNIKINWIINCDDSSILYSDIESIFLKFNLIDIVEIHFFEYNYYFPKRYIDLMVKIKGDFIWCIEDDDEIIDISFLNLLEKKYDLYYFYYVSDFEKITQFEEYHRKNKILDFENLQISQIVFSYRGLKYLRSKHRIYNKSFFTEKNYINYDEYLLDFLLKNNFKIKIYPKIIFRQKIHYDNMSIKGLIKWK